MTTLQAYLHSDRQWKREHRIVHARTMLRQASSAADKNFWKAVLQANGAWVGKE